MSNLGGIPYFDAHFDKQGASTDEVSVAAGTTDLYIMSHGWRNQPDEATAL